MKRIKTLFFISFLTFTGGIVSDKQSVYPLTWFLLVLALLSALIMIVLWLIKKLNNSDQIPKNKTGRYDGLFGFMTHVIDYFPEYFTCFYIFISFGVIIGSYNDKNGEEAVNLLEKINSSEFIISSTGPEINYGAFYSSNSELDESNNYQKIIKTTLIGNNSSIKIELIENDSIIIIRKINNQIINKKL